jgi:Tol biopolymer transport system component
MDTDVHTVARRRPARAAGPLAAALAGLALLPAIGAAAVADRGPIAYTEFDAIKMVGELGGRSDFAPGAEPAWSPDGRWIAYLTGPFGGPYTAITIASADGSGARDLARVDAGGVMYPLSPAGLPTSIITNFELNGVTDPERLSGLAWSPDGTRVRFAVQSPGRMLLFGIEVATGAMEILDGVDLPRGATPRDVAWSPAGRLVAFSAAVTRPSDPRCRAGEHRVYTHRLGDDVTRRVATRGALCSRHRIDLRHPAFSPDGTRLVITRITQAKPGRTPLSDLVTVDLGPRGRARSGMRPTAPGLRHVSRAAFSPDGQRIAYVFLRPGKGYVGGIGVMRSDGTARRELVSAPYLLLQHPAWGYNPRG